MAHSHGPMGMHDRKSSKKEFNTWLILPYIALFVLAVVWIPRELSRKPQPVLEPIHLGRKGHKIGNITWEFEPMGYLNGELYVKTHLHGNSKDISNVDLETLTLNWNGKVFKPAYQPTVDQYHYSSALIYQTGEKPKAFSVLLPINENDTLDFTFGKEN